MVITTSRRDILAGAGALAATAALGRPASGSETVDPTVGRKLIFDDSFSMIDPTVWNAGMKPTSDGSGFYGRSAFSRLQGEEGYNPYSIEDDPDTSNGKCLQIGVKYIGRKMQVPHYYGNDQPEFQWISGNIQTAKSDGTILRGWRRGYFEARMKFPRHPLTFPAFWLLNGRSILHSATSIEIDVVEQKGTEPTLYGAYLHEWGQPGDHQEGTGVPTPIDMTERYCRYGVLIDGGRCSIYFERRPVLDQKTGQPLLWHIGRADQMDSQGDVFWPLLTLALRSDIPFPNPLLPEHREAHMRVDYMQVYA